ncbi:MAG TPA: DUF1360 domain-containing protein [Solirubrobacterales bacterium]|nr:DUF1360 domain-containing protein [Solirubrobacterales bacterium]
MDTSARSDPAAGYDPDGDRPLAPYTALTATFGIGFVASLWLVFRRRGELPEGYGLLDVLMLGIATHKLSRLVTKDKVTAFARAPFTRLQEPAGHGELDEAPRGDGIRYAIGELLVCPYCVAQWVAAGFAVGTVGAPRLTRLLALLFTVHAISDFLQIAYRAAEEAGPG